MSAGSGFENAAIAIAGVASLGYFIRSVYKDVSQGITATLEKEQHEREQSRVKRKSRTAELTNV